MKKFVYLGFLSERIGESLFILARDCITCGVEDDLKMVIGLLLTAMHRGMYSVVEEQLTKLYRALNSPEGEDA